MVSIVYSYRVPINALYVVATDASETAWRRYDADKTELLWFLLKKQRPFGKPRLGINGMEKRVFGDVIMTGSDVKNGKRYAFRIGLAEHTRVCISFSWTVRNAANDETRWYNV